MLRQRLFAIFAGYEDCNDHDTLRDDPVLKLVARASPADRPPPVTATHPVVSGRLPATGSYPRTRLGFAGGPWYPRTVSISYLSRMCYDMRMHGKRRRIGKK
jgi:hypothetical protein